MGGLVGATHLLQHMMGGFGGGRAEMVRVKDRSKVEKTLLSLITSGPSSLQVITDFDATLTRYHLHGKKCDSSYGIIATTPWISPTYRTIALELYNKYYPIEIDPTLSMEHKIPFMVEWYEKSHDCLVNITPKLNKSVFTEMIKESSTYLRDGAKETLVSLDKAEVPVLVLSAGIGDVVQEVLKQNDVDLPNIQVISNFMKFDENGDVIGFNVPLIHMYNKSEAALHDLNIKYFDSLQHRRNVILMGDSLGDTNMASGIAHPATILKIGFLNSHQNYEEHLDQFMTAFDIVLIDDQSMDFVNLLLTHILK